MPGDGDTGACSLSSSTALPSVLVRGRVPRLFPGRKQRTPGRLEPQQAHWAGSPIQAASYSLDKSWGSACLSSPGVCHGVPTTHPGPSSLHPPAAHDAQITFTFPWQNSMLTCSHTLCTHAYTHAHTHVHSAHTVYTLVHTCMHTQMCTHRNAHMNAHTCTHNPCTCPCRGEAHLRVNPELA